jgi:hypothetical protein
MNDELGIWKDVATINTSIASQIFSISPTSNLILRFTPIVDWDKWDINYLIRSHFRYFFEYGITFNNRSTGYRYYPDKIPIIKSHDLIDINNLTPLRINLKTYRNRYYKFQNFVNFMPWELKIEQFTENVINNNNSNNDNNGNRAGNSNSPK